VKRPLRSVMVCNPSYLSAYVLGVAQAMGQLGHWHREVSVLDEPDRIARQLEEMRPDVIWTHTVPWVPRGAPSPGWLLLDLLAAWRDRGARVLLHDGDPRAANRYPHDLSRAVDAALCNHSCPRGDWKVPAHRWLYAAMAQKEMGQPVDALRCFVLFAGIVRRDDSQLYGPRSDVLGELRLILGDKLTIRTATVNDRMQAADVAVSAGAVLGFGRPEVPGWVDTRVFQYPGAGGLLMHDDAGGILEPGRHFLQFTRGSDAFETARNISGLTGEIGDSQPMRAEAFAHIQKHHTWRHRVVEALGHVGLA